MDKVIVAKYTKGGTRFEVVIDPEKATLYRQGKASLSEALRFPTVFTNANKGDKAGSTALKKAFGTDNEENCAAEIIRKGDIPQSKTQREERLHQVRQRIIDLVHNSGVDPRTHAPHPRTRIELALDEAKVRLDPDKTADSQLQEVLSALRPLIPIKSEMHDMVVEVPASEVGNALRVIKGSAKVLREKWGGDGSLSCTLQIPGGLSVDFQDSLMRVTHGKANFTVLKRE